MLYFVTWVTDFAIFLLIFSVSRLLAEQQVSPITVGIIGALFSGANMLSNACSGRFSDRWGRRKVAASGVVLLIAGVAGVTTLPSPGWLYVASYAVCGIAAGMIYPAIIAWLSHGRNGRNASRVILRFCLSFNLGLVAGQLLGGTLFEQLGYRWPLYTAIGLLTTSLTLILSLGNEPRNAHDTGKGAIDSVPEERALSAAFTPVCWVANIGGAFSISMVFYLLPIVLVDLKIPSDQHGVMLAVSRVAVIATFFAMHLTSFWHHRFSTGVATHILGVAGLIGLATATSPLGLTCALLALSVLLGYNYFSGLYYSNVGSADHRRGAASGLHEATLALGFSAGPLCGGFIGHEFGNRAPFILAAGTVATMLLVQILVYLKQVVPVRRQQAFREPIVETLGVAVPLDQSA